jgi:hypothetical protein
MAMRVKELPIAALSLLMMATGISILLIQEWIMKVGREKPCSK